MTSRAVKAKADSTSAPTRRARNTRFAVAAKDWKNGVAEAVDRMREHLSSGAPIKFDTRDRHALAFILEALSRRDTSVATARAEGMAEAAAAMRRVLHPHMQALGDIIEGEVRALATAPHVGTGSEYERGLRRAADVCAQRATHWESRTEPWARESALEALRIEDILRREGDAIRAGLPTDAPTKGEP